MPWYEIWCVVGFTRTVSGVWRTVNSSDNTSFVTPASVVSAELFTATAAQQEKASSHWALWLPMRSILVWCSRNEMRWFSFPISITPRPLAERTAMLWALMWAHDSQQYCGFHRGTKQYRVDHYVEHVPTWEPRFRKLTGLFKKIGEIVQHGAFHLFQIIIRAFGRKGELMADSFACSLGYAFYLRRFLERFDVEAPPSRDYPWCSLWDSSPARCTPS